MRVIYFTTAMENEDFKQFSSRWSIALNPSNQNFHNKLIRAIGINNSVQVISIRPFSKKNCRIEKLVEETKTDGNVTWNYLAIPRNRLKKIKSCKKQTMALLKNLNLIDTIFITDTINPTVLTIANKVNKKFKRPIIGLCTDSPSNISGTTRSYTLYLLSQAKSLDGCIALTKGLNELFNDKNKPNMIIEGLVENELPNRGENLYGKYIFFGGALMQKYGVYNLIEAYKQLNNMHVKLVICGHHCNEEQLKAAIGNNQNIIYLGIQPVKKVLELEQWAIANVNPRPYSEDFDRYSIPSKTIEYLSSGVPTISIQNSKLSQYFKDEIIWVSSNDVNDLKEAMASVIKMSQEERDQLGLKAKRKVNELYSLTTVNQKVNEFLFKFIQKN